MVSAPQDRLVECVQPSGTEIEAGRYAVAKADIKPGELVLVAAPYVAAINPNEMNSAMYIVAKVDEWVSVSKGVNTANNFTATKLRKKNGFLPASRTNDHVPLSPCSSLCCNCLKRIPGGVLFLNYETICWVSATIAAEHATSEKGRWMEEEERNLQGKADGMHLETETCEEAYADKQVRKLQKPTKSTRMRSKGYTTMKQNLSEAAARRREAEMHEYNNKMMQVEKAQEMSWPERVVEVDQILPDDVLSQGVCGCAGCGVVVYCSKECWMEHHELHRTSSTCQTLRRVYPVLMKTFMMRGGNNINQSRKKRSSPDSWSAKQWLRRIGEEAAWEMQSLLLASLLVSQCAKEGFAGHMAEETGTTSSAENYNEKADGEPDLSFADTDKNMISLDLVENKEQLNCGIAVAESPLETKPVSIATDSTIPHEVEMIRTVRLQCGTAIDLLDPRAVEYVKSNSNKMEASSHLYVSLNDERILRVCNKEEEATHAIQIPRWVDVARLVTNLSVLNKESRSRFRCYYRRFVKLILPWLNDDDDGNNPNKLTVTDSFFDRLSAAVQCNSFGLFDADGNCIGVVLYPEASYFNHSCYPNICRVTCRGRFAAFYALREIQKGEPLTICYVDVHETSTAERRRTLLSCYRFFCQCDRCRGAITTTTTTPDIRLCDSCVARGYVSPIPPFAASHWGMDDVREGMCSVCRHRVSWNQR